MDRRGFITIMAAGSCFALSPALFSGCSATADAHNLKQLDSGQTDIRLKLLSFAMLAPNSHNIQPWLVKLTAEDGFDLFVDQTRLLPQTDPPARQIHISQGTFLAFLKIAASGFGYRLAITYFPEGEYGNTVIEDKPVARVRLIVDASVSPDPLFSWLQIRQSNKRVYEGKPIPQQDLDELQKVSQDNGLKVVYSKSRDLIRLLGPMLGKAMDIETADPDRHRETVDIFRFSEDEALRKGDGFTLANNGVTGLMRLLVETFFLGTREKGYATDSAFATEGIKMAHEQAKSAAAYGWIVSETNSRLDQVRSGELYARINLETAKMGIGQHPMSQILEEYQDMADLQKNFLDLLDIEPGNTVQMLFRLGYAESVPHTKRRSTVKMLA